MVKRGEMRPQADTGRYQAQGGQEEPRRALERGDTLRREDLGQLEDGAHVLAVVCEDVLGEAAPQKGEPTSKS